MLTLNNQRSGKPGTTFAIGVMVAMLMFSASATAAFEKGHVRLAGPSWPGSTTKSNVAMQILEALGYETSRQQVGLSFVYNGMQKRQIDAFFANWSPSQDAKIKPYLDKGDVKRVATNIDDAILGMAVPRYVWDKGVHSLPDLDDYAKKFDHKIYSNEKGSAMSDRYEKAVADDIEGLGEWDVVTSSTSGMLAAVQKATKNKEWIVFGGWKPHWMVTRYDLKFLKDPNDTGLASNKTRVYTVLADGYEEFSPNVARFCKQFIVGSEVQSKWIYEFSYKNREASAVAREWISNNMDIVEKWLKGVKTRDGEQGIEAVRAAF